MQKGNLLVAVLIIIATIGISQNYSMTLKVSEVDVSKLKPGDDVFLPVIMVEKSGGLVAVFQLFIGFDHSLLTWKGTWEDPLPGIRNIHSEMPYSSASWLFNDNSNQMVAIWDDPNFKGVEMKPGDLFFEFIFTYKGGLESGKRSEFIWGDTYEDVDGRLMKGKTEIYDEELRNFDLIMVGGFLKN